MRNFKKDNRGAGKLIIFVVVIAVILFGVFGVAIPKTKENFIKKDKDNVTEICKAFDAILADKSLKGEIKTGKEGVVTTLTLADVYYRADGTKDTPLYLAIRKQLGDTFDQRLNSTKKDYTIVITGFPWIFEYAVYAGEAEEGNQLYPKMNYEFYDTEKK